MMKHLFWYPWVLAALVAGILFCLGLIAYMLLQPAEAALHPGAQLVMEDLGRALL